MSGKHEDCCNENIRATPNIRTDGTYDRSLGDARIQALETKFHAWATRLQRLERSSPLEERIRTLEATLERLPTASEGGNRKAFVAATGTPATTTTTSTTTDFNSAIVEYGSLEYKIMPLVNMASFMARPLVGFFGAVLRLGSDILVRIPKQWRVRIKNNRFLQSENLEADDICNKLSSQTHNPSNCDKDGQIVSGQSHSTNMTFCLAPGMDGYSQSLSIETCGNSLSDRAKVSALHREALRRKLDSYIDPKTGYDVFSAHHLKTRDCCGSSCRHCPWGHRNVPGRNRVKPLKKEHGDGNESQWKDATIETRPQKTAFRSLSNETETMDSNTISIAPEATAATIDLHVPPKSRLYTRKGDTGYGELYSNQTIAKSNPIYEAIGDVDELNSSIGLAIELLSTKNASAHQDPIRALRQLPKRLEQIQAWLLDLASALCTPQTTNTRKFRRTCFSSSLRNVREIEQWIDCLDAQLAKLRNFILPSGSPGAAALHLARAVCRRAERRVWALVLQQQQNVAVVGGVCYSNHNELGVFLNRLSDFLFVAARLDAHAAGSGDARYGIDRKSGDLWQRKILRG